MFDRQSVPALTAMVAASSAADAMEIMRTAGKEGAEAFYLQLELLPRAERNEETLRPLFAAAGGRPVIVTAYRFIDESLTGEESAGLLLLGLRCGAAVCDVMGDLFAPATDQMTFDPEAVRKQEALIGRIHALGGKVLMSSHLSRFFAADEIMAYAAEQQRRGADIIKIVTKCGSEEELHADLRIIADLKRMAEKPFLFLGNGAFSRILRLVGPSLGVCMYLTVAHHTPLDFPEQPSLKDAVAMRRLMYPGTDARP